ncbi:MAG: diheme cytochrome c-553 [Betaproteobacteria bacterium]|nr:diheme cytochrome c-553 [Betaproteobacteria bacterium]
MRIKPFRFTLAALAAVVASGTALADPAAQAAQIKRGKYLVDTGGCHDCHTPLKMGKQGPEPDMGRALSGHPATLKLPPPPKLDQHWVMAANATNTAYAGPWGVSYAINITSDKDTGIGNWKAEDFVKALKTGKHLGVGRPILPPMPWQAYSGIEEADLKAMFAYLKSTPPIKNRAPDYQPPAAPAK